MCWILRPSLGIFQTRAPKQDFKETYDPLPDVSGKKEVSESQHKLKLRPVVSVPPKILDPSDLIDMHMADLYQLQQTVFAMGPADPALLGTSPGGLRQGIGVHIFIHHH